MKRNCVTVVVLGTALLLAGCEFADNALLPSLSGSSATGGTGSTAGSGSQASAGKPTSTPAGQKVAELRNDLTKLQSSVAAEGKTLDSLRADTDRNAKAYHDTVAAINTKLQVGTPPGNPELLKQWNDAQGLLEKINQNLTGLNKLGGDISASAGMANYLVDASRAAANIPGAVEEDHRQLQAVGDEADKTTVVLDRLNSDVTDEIQHQTAYLNDERNNLNILAAAINQGQALGPSLASSVYASAPAPAMAPGAGRATGRPLVTIRFDRPNPDYQQALYQAVSQAIARRPNVAFDLVAVAPSKGDSTEVALNSTQSQRDADDVRRSLISMGLAANRISMSSATSPTAQVNEVHLYVR